MQEYIFLRETAGSAIWYAEFVAKDETVLQRVRQSPGTTKVETLDGEVVYELHKDGRETIHEAARISSSGTRRECREDA